jgi:transcription elongation factor Elf1
MRFRLSAIPGTPNKPPDHPGKMKCPHCNKNFTDFTIKKDGDKVKFCCPNCGKEI